MITSLFIVIGCDDEKKITSINIIGDEHANVGEQKQYLVYDQDNNQVFDVDYSINDNKLASINDNGDVDFLETGLLVITAKKDNLQDTINVQIDKIENKTINEINITNKKEKIQIGESFDLEYSILPKEVSLDNSKIEIVSSDNTIASINGNKVTGISAGKVKITCQLKDDPSINDYFELEVLEIQRSILIDKEEITIFENEEKEINIQTSNVTLMWKSSDENIAIFKDGKILGLKKGECYITFYAEENETIFDKIKVNIENNFIDDFIINCSEACEYNKYLVFTLDYDSQKTTKFTYSYDKEFFSYESNQFKALKLGETKIIVTEENSKISKEMNIFIYELSAEALDAYLCELYTNIIVDKDIDFVYHYYDSEVIFEYSSNDPKNLSSDGKYTAPILTIDSELSVIYYLDGEELCSFIPIKIKGYGNEFDVVYKYVDGLMPEETMRTLYLPTSYLYFDTIIDWYLDGKLIPDGIFSFERTSGDNYDVTFKCVIKINGDEKEKTYTVRCIMKDSMEKVTNIFDLYQKYFDENEVNSDVELLTKDEKYGATLSWYSWNSSVITDEGLFTKPFNDISVSLYLTVILGEYEKRGVITINVKGYNYETKWDEIENFLERINKKEIKTQTYYLYGWEEGYQYVLTKNIGYLPFYIMDELTVNVDILPDNSPLKANRMRSSTKYITLHNTGMAHPTATAQGLNEYIHTTDRIASWHFSVDDKEAYQELKLGEVGWHAGDGSYSYGDYYYNEDYKYWSIGGGNNNSIGIEMCVYSGCDFNMVMRNTAKLVSKLLIQYNLTPSDVRQHHDFSGKNCPQVIREAGRWAEMIELISLEYFVRTNLKDTKIKFESLSPEYLDDQGRIIKNPNTLPTVNYKVIVELDGVEKEYTYSSKLLSLK